MKKSLYAISFSSLQRLFFCGNDFPLHEGALKFLSACLFKFPSFSSKKKSKFVVFSFLICFGKCFSSSQVQSSIYFFFTNVAVFLLRTIVMSDLRSMI